MVEGNTLLSYEMGWELRLFDLMTASQQAGDYIMACKYGEAFMRILGLDEIPTKKIPGKSGGGAELAAWQEFYTEILMASIGKIGTTINSVRAKYQKEMTIPRYIRQQEMST